jgi:transposase
MNPGMELMQDGAPGHSPEYTLDELCKRSIGVISWPAYSPDLNPIETLWNSIKNELQEKILKNELRLATSSSQGQLGCYP